MRKWSPEELPRPAAPGFRPLEAAGRDAGFQPEFGPAADADPLARLTPAERERARQRLAAEVAAAVEARDAECARRREEELRAFGDGLATAIEAQNAAVMQAVARAAADLALAVAARVVRREVEADPEVLARVIEDLLLRLPAGAPLSLTVHPDDAAWLEAQPELRRRLRVGAVQADRRVQRGGCTAVADRREWDATVAGQLSTLGEAVAAALAESAGGEEGEDAPRAVLA